MGKPDKTVIPIESLIIRFTIDSHIETVTLLVEPKPTIIKEDLWGFVLYLGTISRPDVDLSLIHLVPLRVPRLP